ncbi:dihydropyrimidinase-like isoform X2 [Cimex lectularius]|uniref:dihydropyrimidinase n=1 Tax=Cimex lectularius TaxID=79782 RepID=A0A8I6RP06_CIMLE|nr:dihydropyrimidinase-like isoform X2 [Cimex lectularius]
MSTPVKKVPIHLQSSQNRLLLKHGKVVNADGIQDADVFIEDGLIKEIGKNLIIPGGTRVLDVRGMYIMPGGIDPHTHLQYEFMNTVTADDFYQGTKAAIAGGTTMIFDFALPSKGESLLDAYEKVRNNADGKACCDYSLHVGVTWWSDKVMEEMEALCNNNGVNSFKMFMTYKDLFMLNDSELYNAFAKCKELGAVPMVHAENGHIIAEVQCPVYLDGLTSKTAADIAANFKEDPKVVGAVMASSLGIDVLTPSVNTVTSPPIRSHSSLHLIQLLADGFLHVTGSDHRAYTTAQKNAGKGDFSKIPPGVNGVEDRMSIIWEKGVESGAMDPTQFVAITSANAAKIFNLYPRKGCIAVGSDADIVVWNHSKTRTISAERHHHSSNYNVFEGLTVHGVPEYVIVNGRVCLEEGEVKPVQGFGRFVPTPTFPTFLYNQVEESQAVNGDGQVNNSQHSAHSVEDNHSVKSDEHVEAAGFMWDSSVNKQTGKGMRQEGQRNLQDSTFSISCEMDDTERRSCIRVFNPPGGPSSGFW